jgi:hypothetical protein
MVTVSSSWTVLITFREIVQLLQDVLKLEMHPVLQDVGLDRPVRHRHSHCDRILTGRFLNAVDIEQRFRHSSSPPFQLSSASGLHCVCYRKLVRLLHHPRIQ